MTESRAGEEQASGTPLTLARVRELVGGRCVGTSDRPIVRVAPIDEADVGDLAVLISRRYVRYVADCRAEAFFVSTELESVLGADVDRVVVDDPSAALLTLLTYVHPPRPSIPSVHPTAVLGTGVHLGADVSVGPYVVLGDGVHLGHGSTIGAHCVLGRDSLIGAHCALHPHVVLYPGTHLGNDVTVHSGARLGVDGFGYVFRNGAQQKVPQVGRCVIDDGVEIGANSTIDRGSLGDTRVGRGVKLDNLVHVAHNVRIGAHSLLAALVGIAGSTRLGQGVWMGGQSGAVDHVEIGDGAKVAVQTGVTRDVPPGDVVSGFPGRRHRDELRRKADVGRIPGLRARIAALEAEVARLSDE